MKRWNWWMLVLCWSSIGICGWTQEKTPDSGDGQPQAEVNALENPSRDPVAVAAGGKANPAEQPPKAADAVANDAVLNQRYQQAMVIDVRGPIFGGLKSYLFNRLDVARRAKIDLVILRVTSPGGSLEDSMDIAKRLSEIDWATTIAFIPEEAYSGAAILSLGCDRIYMRPRALIGDAGPIELRNGAFQHVEEKMVSAIAAEMHQLALAKKRPGAMAEAMVDRHMVVHEATHKQTGQRTFLTAKQIEEPRIKQDYTIGEVIPESGQNRFLTVAGARAIELMIAEGLFDSESELLDKLSIENVRKTERTWVDTCVYILNRPVVTGLLLLAGMIGLYVELTVPGISVAGLISLASFALFFWSHALGGTSGWLEVMLFALGVSCLCIELFILPGSTIFGLSGVTMIVLSLVMASQDFVLPQTTIQWATLRNNLLMVMGAMTILIIAFIVQITYFDSIPGLNRLKLEAPDAAELSPGSPIVNLTSGSVAGPFQPEIGQFGVADSVLRPAGKVRFENQIVDVVTEGDFLDPGTPVEVIKREGNRIVVRKSQT